MKHEHLIRFIPFRKYKRVISAFEDMALETIQNAMGNKTKNKRTKDS